MQVFLRVLSCISILLIFNKLSIYFDPVIASKVPFKACIPYRRQSSNGWVSQENSTQNFLKNEHFVPPGVSIGCRKCFFFGNIGLLCFLVTLVLRFALFPYYRPYTNISHQPIFRRNDIFTRR